MLCACAHTITLDSGEEHAFDRWTLNQEGSSKIYDVEVPSTVAGALCDMGVLGENLLDSDNYYSVDKTIFDTPWVYKTDFKLNKLEGQHYDLVFNGLNYYADITLNGICLATSDTT